MANPLEINPKFKEQNEKYQATMTQALDSFRLMIEVAEEHARYKRVMYDSYITEGFTPEQALALIVR